jgi:hypothetical protein
MPDLIKNRRRSESRRNFSKILSVVVGDQNLASSRVRAHDSLELLGTLGHKIRVVNTSRTRMWPIRAVALLIYVRPDVTHLQKVIPPSAVSLFIRRTSRFLIYELDDAIYFGYPGSSQAVRARSAKRVLRLANAADRVVVSSPEIARDLEAFVATEICVFPGPAPARPRPAPADEVGDDPLSPVTLWLGSPSTKYYVESIETTYTERVSNSERFGRLVLVGSDRDRSGDVQHEVWTQSRESFWLRRASVGIMPIADDEWSRRKAAYKILVYLAHDIIPVTTRNSVSKNVLGASFEQLCEVVAAPADETEWLRAISRAHARSIDSEWVTVRDELFAALSLRRYTAVLIPLMPTPSAKG